MTKKIETLIVPDRMFKNVEIPVKVKHPHCSHVLLKIAGHNKTVQCRNTERW